MGVSPNAKPQRESAQTQREPPRTQRELNSSRWNIDRVGSPRLGACVGHVHFMFFVSILFALATGGIQAEEYFQLSSSNLWNTVYGPITCKGCIYLRMAMACLFICEQS